MENKAYTVVIRSDKSIRTMVYECLKDLRIIQRLIPHRSRILLKPNIVAAKPNNTGATTSPLVLDSLIEQLMYTSPNEIIIGESSEVGDDTMQAYKVTGVYEVAKKWKVTLLDFKKDRYISADVPRGKVLKEVLIAETVKKVDYLINVPILKVHSQTTVTIGMKNLKGCIPDKEKSRFHRLNLHQCIVDLNTVIIPDLTIVDATLCSLQWELGGLPVQLNTVLVSRNVLAADIIAASILGYHISDVEHLQIAAQSYMGPSDLEDIKIINPMKLRRGLPIQTTGIDRKPSFQFPGIDIIEKGTCSSCKGALQAAMRRISREGRYPSCTILMGQRVREREDEISSNLKTKKLLLSIGHCCNWVVDSYQSKQIDGCPVRAETIYRHLKTITP